MSTSDTIRRTLAEARVSYVLKVVRRDALYNVDTISLSEPMFDPLPVADEVAALDAIKRAAFVAGLAL